MASNYLIRSRGIQKLYQLAHYYFLSEKKPGSTLSDLSFNTDIATSIDKFKTHNWTPKEVLHYGFLSSVIFFVFCIFPASIFIKLPILLVFMTCCLIPLTSQFFIHALPIFSWLALFFSCGKIPTSWKPPISVKVLPAMETIMYGDNLSNVLATTNTSILDILACIPYGILHFSAPFVVAIFIFVFGPPTSLRSFGFAFGYINLFGVMCQILFPAAPPWYKNLHGLEPANYSMSGSPGGLGRIDEILGFDMYTSTFSNSPVVFGAFPSLHSGCSVMDVLFLCWLFPKYKIVWWGYATWLWWSTMYLTHHYFIDLIGGAVLSFIVFHYTKYTQLPVIVPNNFCRWSYTEIKKVDIAESDPLSVTFVSVSDLESNDTPGPLERFPYFYSQAPIATEEFEMGTYARSRQASRSAVPISMFANSSANLAIAKSSSSINLPIIKGEPEIETSSLENSGTPSVFEENVISANTSSTSLDDISSLANPTKPYSSNNNNSTPSNETNINKNNKNNDNNNNNNR